MSILRAVTDGRVSACVCAHTLTHTHAHIVTPVTATKGQPPLPR